MKYARALQKLVDLYLVGWSVSKEDNLYVYWVVNPAGMSCRFPVKFSWENEDDRYCLLRMLRQQINRITDKCVLQLYEFYDIKNDVRYYDDELKNRVRQKIKAKLQELLGAYV